jgi:hypothetical protein
MTRGKMMPAGGRLLLRPVQPRPLKADLQATLVHISPHMTRRCLDEGKCCGADANHIATDVSLHLLADPAELLRRRGRLELVPQCIDFKVLVVEWIETPRVREN